MGKFGIGARVIDGDGDTGVIVGKRKGERLVGEYVDLGNYKEWWPKAELTAYPAVSICEETCEVAFSIGDRVMLKSNSEWGDLGVGEVVPAPELATDCGFVGVVYRQTDGFVWAFRPDELTKFTIEAGKFYRTRGGNRVGPMRVTEDGWTDLDGLRSAFDNPAESEQYTADGYYLSGQRNCAEYIVGLWVEPVAVAERVAVVEPALSPVKYEPKFKKGDRLECVDSSDTDAVTLGEVYEAERDCYDGNAFVEIKNVGGLLSRRFRLVAAPSTWTPKAGDKVRWTEKFKASMYTKGKVYEIGREYRHNLYVTDDCDNRYPATTNHSWDAKSVVENFDLVEAPPAPPLPPLGTLVTLTGKLTGTQNNGGNVSVTFHAATGDRSFDVPASAIRAA